MWRYLLLLTLASPLLYVGYQQGMALYTLEPPRTASAEERVDFAPWRAELERLRQTATQRGKIGDDLHRGLLTQAHDLPGPVASGGPLEQTLAPVVGKHARALDEIRTFFTALADLDRGDVRWVNPFPSSHPYHSYLQDRRDLREIEQQLRDLRARPNSDLQELRTLLASYQEKPAHNRRFHHETRAVLHRRETVEKVRLARLLDEVKAALFPRPTLSEYSIRQLRTTARSRLEEALRALEDFAGRFGDLPTQQAWANRELTRWTTARELLLLVAKEPGILDSLERPGLGDRAATVIRNHLNGYLEFISPSVPADVAALVPPAVARFCQGCLPPSLPLDDHVLLSKSKKPFARDQVRIEWKEKKETTLLKDSGYNEFTLMARDKEQNGQLVARFYVGDSSYEKPILPSPKSAAAHAYNQQRKKLRWTTESLIVLRQACGAYEAELADPRKRIDGILAFLADHPDFPEPKD